MKRLLLSFALAALPAIAASQEPLSLLGISAGKAGTTLSAPMQIVILLTLMTILPAAMMAITPFLRITIVLHFLRQALGTQSTPSNQVLLGLAMFLTIVIMQPVAADMYRQGWEPLEAGQITTTQAMDQAAKPLHNFLIRFAKTLSCSSKFRMLPLRAPLPISISKFLSPPIFFPS
jgi:flagellar biosynthetic protein FliP